MKMRVQPLNYWTKEVWIHQLLRQRNRHFNHQMHNLGNRQRYQLWIHQMHHLGDPPPNHLCNPPPNHQRLRQWHRQAARKVKWGKES
jgi:hypothetical protein